MPTIDNPVLVNIPFSESGGNVATDHSGSGANALVVNGGFVAGRVGNAVYFPAEGYAEILAKVVPVGGVFTFCMWVKAEITATGPDHSWLLVKFTGTDRYLYIDLASDLTSWNYICLIQDESSFTANLNSILIGQESFPSDWGKPTGWCLLNDNDSDGPGFCSVEDLTVYEGVVSGEIVTPPLTDMTVTYKLNQADFTTYGVYVSDSDGVIDNLNRKEPFSVEWPDYHGEVVDLSNPRYEPRDITLQCFINAPDKVTFLDRVKYFIALFDAPGTQQLIISANSAKPLVYQVYLKESINLKKKWSDGLMVGTFELKLREPEPIKRVLKFSGVGGTMSLSFTSAKLMTIYWGDGSSTKNQYGNVSLNHGFPGGEFYIVMAGIIEDMTNFSTNATIIWGKV